MGSGSLIPEGLAVTPIHVRSAALPRFYPSTRQPNRNKNGVPRSSGFTKRGAHRRQRFFERCFWVFYGCRKGWVCGICQRSEGVTYPGGHYRALVDAKAAIDSIAAVTQWEKPFWPRTKRARWAIVGSPRHSLAISSLPRSLYLGKQNGLPLYVGMVTTMKEPLFVRATALIGVFPNSLNSTFLQFVGVQLRTLKL